MNTAEAQPVSNLTTARKWQRLSLWIAVILVGWMIQHVNEEWWYVHAAIHLPGNLAWWHSGRADASWIYDTVLVVTFGSWVQELYCRGVVYHYARQVFGVGFAMVFSSSIFAAWHGEAAQFASYFWYGIICAVQYEVSGSLVPSTVSHCVHNLLTSLGGHS